MPKNRYYIVYTTLGSCYVHCSPSTHPVLGQTTGMINECDKWSHNVLGMLTVRSQSCKPRIQSYAELYKPCMLKNTGLYKPSILKNTQLCWVTPANSSTLIHVSQGYQLTLNISDGSSRPLLMSRFIDMNCSTEG